MRLMYDLWILIFSFVSYEECFNFRLINRECYQVYKYFSRVRMHLDPMKHVFFREDPMGVFEFQEMIVKNDRRFVRFKKGRNVVIRSLKNERDGTLYCRDLDMRFNIFKIERRHCERCNNFTYCKDVMLLETHCSIVNCNKKCNEVINHLFHKHKYCVRCRELFKHILKIHDGCKDAEDWWRENCELLLRK